MIGLVIFGLVVSAYIAYELYIINHNIIEMAKLLEEVKAKSTNCKIYKVKCEIVEEVKE